MDSEARITLGLLTAVEEDEALTQRSVARDLGIALGLANAYLKRCVTKGFIKVRQIPRNRYAYYLTPRGFSEKSRLTAEYLSQSFNLFRLAKEQYSDLLGLCLRRRWKRVALAGAGDLAEIAALFGARDGVRLVGIVDAGFAGQSFGGLRVVADISGLDAVDAVIITDLSDPQGVYDAMRRLLPRDRLLAPDFLHISTRPGA